MLCEEPESNFKLIRRYINLLNLFIYLFINTEQLIAEDSNSHPQTHTILLNFKCNFQLLF